MGGESTTLLDSSSLAQLDAFPKVPSTYKARSESRGFMTLFVMLMAFVLVLNDVGEFIWGWPDYEFNVDTNDSPYLDINLDMVVAMPCGFLSIDLRDAMGDRLFLSSGLRRDGTRFDVGQATLLKEHADALSARQAVAQSRKSRGLFDFMFKKEKSLFKPIYHHEGDGSACRITGSLQVKRVTANLHITTLGHGYASYQHVDHNQMNLSHVITEFSFGPHFPEIVQPLDNSFETTDQHFIAYQYFLHVVPTTYIAPRSAPLQTHQYSVTHYTREIIHNQGTPGIFFKFDLDPLNITIHQRTTSFLQLLIRCVGVLGGTFVCMGYAIRITTRAVEVVTGADTSPGLVAAESSGVKVGLRAKWGGAELRSRPKPSKIVPQGSGWAVEGGNISPYSSYSGSPAGASYTPNGMPASPYLHSPAALTHSLPGSPNPMNFGPPLSAGLSRTSNLGLGPPPPRPSGVGGARTPSGGSAYSPVTNSVILDPASYESQYVEVSPPTPDASYATFSNGGQSPLTNGNNGNGNGFYMAPPPPRKAGPKKDD